MAMTPADVLKMAKDNEVKFVDFRFLYHNGLDFFLVKLVWLVSMSLNYSDSLVLVQPYF